MNTVICHTHEINKTRIIETMAYVKRLDVGQAFRKNTELLQFILTDVTPTGRILGTGSFGSVEEVSNNLPHPTVLLVEGKEKWSGSSWTEDLSHVCVL